MAAAHLGAINSPCTVGLHPYNSKHNNCVILRKKTRSSNWWRFCMERQKKLPANFSTKCRNQRGKGPKVFVLSDLHTDYSENMAWVQRLSTEWYRNDILLVAGDVAETLKNFVSTMSELKQRFGTVFYVPGNHDLWCRREGNTYNNSLEKLNALLDACSELGVETGPRVVDGHLGIVPLFSWYHKSFDKEKEVTGVRIPPIEMACKDFHACKWPKELLDDDLALARYFDMMNDKYLGATEEARRASTLITLSHFVPRQALCPEKRMLFYPNLPKIIGSDFLELRLRSIHGENGSSSACHIFGHTHFIWDAVHEGIRYVQAPLAYPAERKRRMNGGEDWLPFCVFSEGLTDRISPSYWSDYYSNNKRTPDNVELAPWVARFYKRS